ncbi:PEP-CTERM sorting domain-containing protein [Akkermansiaceae bacterium]|nr:PEP-CTERM sorting domain-containing protein [Akkermansiaceae bacterium]
MKIKTSHIILAGLFATATALPAATTIIDGFGTLVLDPNSVTLDQAGDNWYNNDGTGVGPAFTGVMTTTTLTVDNDPFANNSRLYETPTAKVINNTASGSILRFSFDYNVTAGSPSLYFHLKGVDVTGASPVWEQQLLGRGGAAFHTDSTNLAANNTDTYNLFTGLDNAGGNESGSNAWAYNGGNLDLTGSGTISGEINLATHGTYTDLSDYEYLAVAFAFDFDEAATVEISNFTLAVPEPSSTALLGLGGLALMLRRKRS